MWYNTLHMKNERQRILVSMPTANYAERMKLEGLLAYAHECKGGRWDILLDNAGFGRRDVDGVVAYIVSEKMRREIVTSHHPAVIVEDLLPLPGGGAPVASRQSSSTMRRKGGRRRDIFWNAISPTSRSWGRRRTPNGVDGGSLATSAS